MHEEINEGPNLGLGEPARRVDGIDALGFDRKIGDRLLHKALGHGVGIEERGQIGDAEARDAGVQLLDDETIALDPQGLELAHVGAPGGDGPATPLVVAGIDWDGAVKGLSARVDRVAGENPSLLLAHNPKAFLAASRHHVPLTLSGHTHGGQVATKARPGVNLAVAHRLSAGFYHRDASTLFVTVGTGSWFPLRVQCPAEIVLLTCRRGEDGVHEVGVDDTDPESNIPE